MIASLGAQPPPVPRPVRPDGAPGCVRYVASCPDGHEAIWTGTRVESGEGYDGVRLAVDCPVCDLGIAVAPVLTPLPHCPNAVVVSHRDPGRCSFVPDWGAHVGALLSHVDRLGGLCGARAAYTVVDTGGYEADLCARHAAHVQDCPACSGWLVSIRTVGTVAPC